MNRIIAVARPCMLLFAAASVAIAQDPSANPTPAPESQEQLKSIREAVEQQTKKIDALTQQVTELGRRLSAQKETTKEVATTAVAPTAPPSASPPTPPPPAPSNPAATPASSTATAPSPAGTAPEAPAPAPAPDGGKHTVAKGETLTSIAKRYNIPLAELEKVNKIEDDRKLQIGQALVIPNTTPASPNSQPTTDKKENP